MCVRSSEVSHCSCIVSEGASQPPPTLPTRSPHFRLLKVKDKAFAMPPNQLLTVSDLISLGYVFILHVPQKKKKKEFTDFSLFHGSLGLGNPPYM